jgi:uncharacterized repeat protein (TIGR01451 family)
MKKLVSGALALLVFVVCGCYSEGGYEVARPAARARTETGRSILWDRDFRPRIAAPGRAELGLVQMATPLQERVAPVRPELVAITEPGSHVTSIIYPCPEHGVIQVDKTMPKEVGLNKPFDYYIKVANLTDVTLSDVVITEDLPDNFEVTGAKPVAKRNASRLMWTIESLEPRASRQITVSGIATDVGDLTHGTTVTHVARAFTKVKVVQPMLKLTKSMPTEALLCAPIPVEYVVTNSGTGTAQNVKIVDTLPAGLQTSDGKSQVVLYAGTLQAGQSRQFTAELRATKIGAYVGKAVAISGSGLAGESVATTTTVRQPILAIAKQGPKRQFLDRQLSYEIVVTNKGDGQAKETIIEDTIPAGVTSVEATAGATFSGSRLLWELGTLEPRASKKVRVSYTPTRAGALVSTAIASAYCAESVSASAETTVTGIAAAHLEVVDVVDPVEVGKRTTYVITVTNEGSAPDTNIRIVFAFENRLRYVSSAGATAGSAMGNMVSFAPLSSLEPKAAATWRVVLAGVSSGDARCRVSMSSDQLVRAVEETEATHIYEQFNRD